jgi:hypothetical protein
MKFGPMVTVMLLSTTVTQALPIPHQDWYHYASYEICKGMLGGNRTWPASSSQQVSDCNAWYVWWGGRGVTCTLQDQINDNYQCGR